MIRRPHSGEQGFWALRPRWIVLAACVLALVIARASPHDPFRPERWWQERDTARELIMESLRWLNSFVLGDFWAERRPCARGDRWGSEGQGVAVAAGIGPALKRS